MPNCNVLPLLCSRRASFESTFIILTFRQPQRGAAFLLLSVDFCAFLQSEKTSFFLLLLNVLLEVLTSEQDPGEY